jgi:hypothetical protein
MRIVVLFNLKPGASPDAYEAWAAATDIPGVRALPSVTHFRVYRTAGLFGTDAPAPYRYVEIIDINALDPFVADVSSDSMQRVAAEFQAFADNPQFILTEELLA